MAKKLRSFFSDRLWNFHLSEKKGWEKFSFKILRIGYLSARGFFQNRCSLRASALTYFALMSLVPVLAMSFAIARGFGYHEHLRNELLSRFQDQRLVLHELFSFTEKMLEQAQGGVIAGIGVAILFWSVILLLNNMEEAFNQIWAVKKARSWRRILSDYFALMLLGPFFFLFSSMMTVYIVGHLETVVRALPIGDWAAGAILFFLRLIPYCLFWLLFTFIYLVIPNAKVRIRSAFLGGIVAGTLFVILQWAYIHFQIGVSRYGAIYGSFAALPLFLVWLQLSWFLVLFGGEISYAHQTLDEHEFEEPSLKASIGFKRLLSLWIVHLAASRFAAHESPLTLQMLTHRYQIPHALAAPLLEELAACRLIAETSTGFIPARPAERLRISDVIEALDDRGIADIPYIDSKALAPFEKTLEHFRSLVENSPRNQRLSHVSDTI